MSRRIIYSSKATRRLSENDLALLLLDARASNRETHITGVLFYARRSFLQLIDAPTQEAMNTVMRKILGSSQHKEVHILQDVEVDSEMFPDGWFMGFEAPRLRRAPTRFPFTSKKYVPDADTAIELLKRHTTLEARGQ